mmetsp:Transcript_55094/g.120163  ORF Transcript_55094/g.120163 Transcript_55094/m.120163 type:complete len:345 (+) Transcript_55094:536-1570(+)
MGLDADQFALMAIFGLSCILGLVTLRLYVRNNSNALLKIAMLSWYVWLCFMSIFNVAISYTYDSTQTTWTTVYNTTGQIMALTGIVDVAQFAYCRKRLLRLHEANSLFFKVYCVGVTILAVGFSVQATLDHLDYVDLLAYRSASLVFISVEFVAYCWVILIVRTNKRAVLYYGLTLTSRFGIIFTVACRVIGIMNNEVFRGVHAGFVLFAVAAIGAFNMPYIVKLSASISEFRSPHRRSERSKVEMGARSTQKFHTSVAGAPSAVDYGKSVSEPKATGAPGSATQSSCSPSRRDLNVTLNLTPSARAEAPHSLSRKSGVSDGAACSDSSPRVSSLRIASIREAT